MARDERITHEWNQLRAHYVGVIASLGWVPCQRCSEPIRPGDAWDLGHRKNVAEGGSVADGVWPEHRACSRRAGLYLAHNRNVARRNGTLPPMPMVAAPGPVQEPAGVASEPAPFDPASLAGVPWLVDLLEVPENAAWPRHMTPPHPDAVGSYGQAAEEWILRLLGDRLLWWQRLWLRRELEHDAAGDLVWQTELISTPRQVGKSFGLRVGALWRTDQGRDLFGEQQLVLHTGKDLPIAKEIHRSAWQWAKARRWTVRRGMGNEELEAPDGSRWIVRGRGSVYGYSATRGLVDEAWGVEADVVDEGLEPTMLERSNSQLLLTSTAHRRATPLMRRRLDAALSGMGEDWDTLLMLWCAGRADDLGDPGVWKAASPHWSDRRAKLIRSKFERAMRGEADPEASDPDPLEGFRAQYLNVWPTGLVATGDTVVSGEEWEALGGFAAPPGWRPAAVAVEARFGLGVSVAAAGPTTGGKVGVVVREFATAPQARAWVDLLQPRLRVAGKSVAVAVGCEPVGGTARQAMLAVRRLVDDATIIHDGSPVLAEQVAGLRQVAGPDGPRLVSRGRTDAVKALAWVVELVQRAPTARPAVF